MRLTDFSSPRLRAAVFLCALLALAACGGEQPQAPARAIADDTGRSVTVPATVTRIVSLAPNVTELLFAIGAGPAVVGTDDYSDFPPRAKRLPKVGSVQADVEKIASLHPDVVVAKSGYHPTLPAALGAAKLPLFISRTDRLAEIPRAMESLGRLTAVDAAPAVSRLRGAIEAQRRTRPRKARVMFLVLTQPLYVAGRDTYADDLFALCGAENAVSASGWPQYSLESLATNPPDIVLHPSRTVTRAQVEALLRSVPNAHAEIAAVDEDRFSRPGPRVGAAAAELNAILDAWAAHQPK